ncbi:MAG: CARDB domain-containing protein, partial [Methylococcales bacterium]|nr:CARDB domain-containing protein [Methylococcales bacterium]
MKKIGFIPLIMTLLTANIAFGADEIHWTFTGPNSVAFDWRGTTTEKTIGYGLASGVYTQVTATTPSPVPVSSSGPFWEANLTGLSANTLYYYKIGTEPEKTFRTPPAPGSSDFNVYALGNMGSSSTYFNTGAVQDIIANDLPSFVVGLGDLTLGSINGTATIDQHFNDVMAWSKEAAYLPVWGDLEWISSSADSFENYKGRFNVPNSQTSPGSPLAGGKDWYWFDYGNTRFITLPEPWSGAWPAWNTAAGDLMSQAQADPNIKFIVTFGHQPAYSSGHYSGSAILKSMLDTLGDTYSKYKLNVNGHSNNYERSFPQHGVTHVTAGTGGANLAQDGTCLWLTCAQPDWSAFRAMHLGALKLHFTGSGIEGSFICGPAGGGTNDVHCAEGNVADIFTIASPAVDPMTATVTSSVAAPDVIVTSLSYVNGVFTSVVKNQGTAATPAGVYVGVSYSVDGTYRTWGSVMGPLAAGASATINTGGGSYSIPTGTHTIMAYVDDVDRIAESNETNNQLSRSITVSGTGGIPSALGIQGFAAAAGVTGGAGGQNTVVTNCNGDSSAGSLKAAIAVNATRTITFKQGMTCTINWTGPYVVYVNYPNMTIDGKGANITISGMSLSVFKSNGTPINNIIIRNLTFANTT